jgi:integrase
MDGDFMETQANAAYKKDSRRLLLIDLSPSYYWCEGGLGHVRPHDLHHIFVTRLLDLGVPIEQVNYLAGHKSMAMTKRYDHANEERYGGAIEALDEAGKTGNAEALAAARWKQR